MAGSSESYVWTGSHDMEECCGCRELRKQVDDLRNMLMSTTSHQMHDDARFNSTHISERQQLAIDKLLLESRCKAETFQEAYEKVLQEKRELEAANEELKKQLTEKANEATVLMEQNAVYAADFQLEREDRERSQNRVVDLEQQLMTATSRIAQLEGDRQQLPMTVRHQNPQVPVHREFYAEPRLSSVTPYPEYRFPAYSSYPPQQPHLVPHHAGRSPRSFGRGMDVCDYQADSKFDVPSGTNVR